MIELVIVHDDGCASLPLARVAVAEAVRRAAVVVRIRELERGDAPEALRNFASPTVLVAGRDVAVGTPCGGKACRVYADADGRLSGAPPIEQIVAALQRASRDQPASTARSRSPKSSPV